jgi:acyl dehydratase
MHAPISPASLTTGTKLPGYSVIAVNDALDSGNPIHEDSAARRHGFGSGLVPGVTVYGYCMRSVVALFGIDFLSAGVSSVQLRKPFYAGEQVSVSGSVIDGSGGGISIEVIAAGAAGEARAVVRATFPGARRALEPPPWAPLPSPRRPATPAGLRAEPVFGTLDCGFDAADDFLATLGDAHPVYRDVVHPAWLLRQANIVLDRNLALGPWVHVASDVLHLGTVRPGERIEVRAQVLELYTRKGHEYADIDVWLGCADRPLMRVKHRAIYRLATAADRATP